MAQQKTTFCRICENQCGLKVTVEGDRIVQVEPDTEHVVSRGFACIKGITLENVRASADRVTTPLKRIGDRFEPISWQRAFNEIGTKLRDIRRRHGDDAVGLYFGNPISFSLLMPMFITGFAQGLNTAKVFTTGSLDCNNKFLVSLHMYGSPMALTFPDVDECRFLMLLGGNPAISKMSFINLPDPVRRLEAVAARGARIVHVNPRRTETAKAVGEQLFIRPDTDVFFLLAFLHEIIARNAVKRELIQQHMNGFDDIVALVKPWTPERQADVTGIAPQKLRELVSAYLAADGAALYASTGINQGSNGSTAFWILEVINAVTGNLDRSGGSLMGLGIVDYAKATANADGKVFHSRIGNTRSFLGALPTALMADEILEPGPDQIRAMFVISGNPVLTGTNSTKTEQAFRQLELTVSIDLVRNETAEFADYILPGTHFTERPDLPFTFLTLSGLMARRWLQYTERMVPPPGDARDEMWILSRLAHACHAPLFGSTLLQTVLDAGEALKRLPLIGKRLKPLPDRLLDLILRLAKMQDVKTFVHGKRLLPNAGGNYLGKRVITPSGKVELAPQALLELARSRLAASYDVALASLGDFKLITKRERYSHNSWAHNDPAFVKGRRETNYLYMHPDDARVLGLREGSYASVQSEAGQVEVPVSITDDLMQGTVALPHGWGHQRATALSVASKTRGVNANLLALDGPQAIEPLSGMAQFNGITVRVTALATPARSEDEDVAESAVA
jgi:anaerobic selenocysteine-containing dehydrogenase